MKRLLPKTLILLFALGACSGSEWGTELSQETRVGTATMFYSSNVDVETAQKVFQAMIDADYNFASDLPEQVDMIDGVLTLRLGNDNKNSVAEIMEMGYESGIISYMQGLAAFVSKATGTPVDIILCRLTLDDEFFEVKWGSAK
ncbi:MAG: hypothetical protein ACYTEP_01125 [Planctomycetota bacterium]